MIASAHLVVGAASGLMVQKYLPLQYGILERVAIGFCAGVASHILTDALPHQEYTVEGYSLMLVVALEVSAVFWLVFSLNIPTATFLVVFGAMSGAALPDFFSFVYRHVIQLPPLAFFSWLFHIYHGELPIGFELSITAQILIALATILLVRYKTV